MFLSDEVGEEEPFGAVLVARVAELRLVGGGCAAPRPEVVVDDAVRELAGKIVHEDLDGWDGSGGFEVGHERRREGGGRERSGDEKVVGGDVEEEAEEGGEEEEGGAEDRSAVAHLEAWFGGIQGFAAVNGFLSAHDGKSAQLLIYKCFSLPRRGILSSFMDK